MYSYYCSLVVWVKYGHFQQSDITFSTSAYSKCLSKYLPLELILVLQIETLQHCSYKLWHFDYGANVSGVMFSSAKYSSYTWLMGGAGS